ncbi:1-acylglycerol-3-phosphate O [Serendipita vermifera]|nr:1-acylglycerol-3-phosphate O [Serendipita vermifera]
MDIRKYLATVDYQGRRDILYGTAGCLALASYFLSRRIRAYIRTCLLVFSIIINSTWGILISVFVGIETNYHATKAFANVCEWTIGLKLIVEGAEHLEIGPSVVLYNHQTMMDMVFSGRAMPRRSVVLAKKSLKWVPFFGQYLYFSRAIFLDRQNNKDAMVALHAASHRLLEQNASLLVFPEGTRSLTPTNTLNPFKKGAFHVAIEAGIPIIPVVFENQWKIYRPGVFEKCICKIKVLPPIPTKGMTSADAAGLAVSTRELMQKALEEISVKA